MFLGLSGAHMLSLFGPRIDGESICRQFHVVDLPVYRQTTYMSGDHLWKRAAYRFSVYMRAK